MPELPLHEKRCEGKTQTVMGASTLCESCIDCVRRTADRDGAQFMQPPVFQKFWAVWVCPEHISPDDLQMEVIV